MKAAAAYDELVRLSRERALLGSCAALLAWDEETYLPPGGAAHRADQLALLAGLEHQKATDSRLGELLGDVDDSPLVRDPLSDAAVNVREWRRQYARLTRLPQALVEETARVTSLAQTEWAAARQRADFRRFLPWLERVVALKQREAEAVGYETEPYDALLDEYEPGARGRDLHRLFAALGEELTALARGWPTRRVGRTPPSSGASSRPTASALSAKRPRRRSASTSHAADSIPPRTRSSPPSAPATAGSPRATTVTTSATPFSARCTKSATGCTNRAWTRPNTACRWANVRRWVCTNRSRACGKTPSAAARPSGGTSSRKPVASSPKP